MKTRCTALLIASLAIAATTLALPLASADIQAHAAYEPPSPQAIDLGSNLFLKAPVKASGHWDGCVPENAVDGRHDSSGVHWAAENTPVWLTVELKEPRELNLIRLWTYWDNRRYYQFYIEGSLDGAQWTMLADRRSNTTPATDAGESFVFPTTRLKYIRTTFTHDSVGDVTGGHIVEIEGYCLDPQQADVFSGYERRWSAGPSGLQGAFGSIDERYPRDEPPQLVASKQTQAWSATAWRGERVHAQIVLWSRDGASQVRFAPTELRGDSGATIPASCVRPSFERYVLGEGKLLADILDTAQRLDIPSHNVRPIWVSVDVPRDAKPGVYRGRVDVLAAGKTVLPFQVNVEVLPAVLPPPAAWSFRLDLWQNPFAIARYHHVQPWSEEHLRLLEPHMRLLASAGQKCVTASIIHHPWGTQTYDPYDSMIEWKRHRDGTWSYDYTIFDKWVELATRCGITDSINCYTVAMPQYLDEATGDYTSGGMSLEDIWRPFLKDFTAHLKAKGWLGKTALAMDEWPLPQMKPMIAFIRKTAPQLKIALAGSNEPELKNEIDDWCVFIAPPLDPAIARERALKGRTTTFYVCCGPGRPNTFTFSPPAEAAWLGWYAAAQGYSGLLRWAYDSWVSDPMHDTSYVTWPAGDCFLVYPGARSSVRFERLREGIQDFEKVRIVRAALAKSPDAAAKAALQRLNTALAKFTYEKVQTQPAADAVNEARSALTAASRQIAH